MSPFDPPVAAVVHGFSTTLAVLGGLLMLGALVSGLARRSFLALAPLYVLAGFALGHGGLKVLHFSAGSGFVTDVATVALVVILFRDGLEVDREFLQKSWHLPLRKLGLAMPITCGVVALATKVVTDLTWTEAFLVGALLSPTDPVLSSGVVSNPRVPQKVRHSLNLESGLNDGLALAPVLALSMALGNGSADFKWWTFVIQDVGLGLVFGLACGLLGSLLMPRRRALTNSIPAHQHSLYVLGLALATYGATTLPPHGNGLIAVFVASIVLGIRRPDLRVNFEARSAEIIEIVKLGVLVVFGSLLTLHGLFTDDLAPVAIAAVTLLIARPAAIWLSLSGTGLGRAQTAFIAWFGPKGVSTMAFSLLVIGAGLGHTGDRIFNLAAFCVVCSALAHGLTDTPGVRWIARRTTEDA